MMFLTADGGLCDIDTVFSMLIVVCYIVGLVELFIKNNNNNKNKNK